jgi:hypothetical protein
MQTRSGVDVKIIEIKLSAVKPLRPSISVTSSSTAAVISAGSSCCSLVAPRRARIGTVTPFTLTPLRIATGDQSTGSDSPTSLHIANSIERFVDIKLNSLIGIKIDSL